MVIKFTQGIKNNIILIGVHQLELTQYLTTKVDVCRLIRSKVLITRRAINVVTTIRLQMTMV